MRRPAPAGPPAGAIIAAIVVVAVFFVGGAAGVGWILFRPKGEPVSPSVPATVVPTPGLSAAPTTPPADATPVEVLDAAGTTEESPRVTIEELAVPTSPPPAIARDTAQARPTAGTATSALAPTPEPEVLTVPSAGPSAGGPATAASRLERVIPFRTAESIPLGIVDRLVTIESVEVTGWPKDDDVRKAERKPADTTKLTVTFTYANRNDEDWKCQYRVAILDERGTEIGSGEREAGLNGDEESDTNRVSVKMRTIDFPKAAKLRVRILARPD
jgi:hypothetical protein